MLPLLRLLLALIKRSFSTRSHLLLENLALRQQLAVLKHRHPRPRIAPSEKLFWVMLRRIWPGWNRALILVNLVLSFAGIGLDLGCTGSGFRGTGTEWEENASTRNCVS